MNTKRMITASEARAAFNDTLSRVSYGHERVTITRNGKPAAVLVSVEDLRRLEQLEDAHWGERAHDRMTASRAAAEQPRSWRDVKTKLGL